MCQSLTNLQPFSKYVNKVAFPTGPSRSLRKICRETNYHRRRGKVLSRINNLLKAKTRGMEYEKAFLLKGFWHLAEVGGGGWVVHSTFRSDLGKGRNAGEC